VTTVPRPPTILERAMMFLKTHPGTSFCAGCLAEVLGIRGTAAHTVMPKLEGQQIFRVRHGACSRCGRNRLVAVTKT
jgi:hypothetical protein